MNQVLLGCNVREAEGRQTWSISGCRDCSPIAIRDWKGGAHARRTTPNQEADIQGT